MAFIFMTTPAMAYLDPGTGSIILQGLIGAVVGGLVAAKIYWGRIKSLFVKSSEDEVNSANESSNER